MNEDSVENSVLRRTDRLLTEETTDVLESFTVNRQRLQTAWDSAITIAIQSSPGQQLGIGLGVGWVTGYLFRRVSRTAAFIVGCGFLVVQGASSLGIITVNWQRMRSLAVHNIHTLESRMMSLTTPNNEQTSLTQRLLDLSHRHMFLCSGFVSGLVVGLTF